MASLSFLSLFLLMPNIRQANHQIPKESAIRSLMNAS